MNYAQHTNDAFDKIKGLRNIIIVNNPQVVDESARKLRRLGNIKEVGF